ncbi:OsmC family protein [Vibrio sp. A14(2019)]|uniref:OsmC family protein n=1 Tax=Vibrio sp. A14(2019) TaxID=2591428 RepID=UPI0027CF98F7|nr:OsmC family protein [Vibrio sp. A14(2019)]MDQ2194395.1 OsmC family protein [Vibrio sp. A14(2019)]
MKAEVKWIEDLKFVGKTDKNQEIIMASGDSTYFSPMEMVLMAAGGCSSVDVVNGLKQAQQAVTGCRVSLITERRETAPRLFTHINLHFTIEGNKVSSEIVEQVVADSLNKYCSVCLMLGESIDLTHSWEVINA